MRSETQKALLDALRTAESPLDAAQALANWLGERYGWCYAVLPDGFVTAPGQSLDAELVRWLKDREHRETLEIPQIVEGALVLPLRYAGRVRGLLALPAEGDEETLYFALELLTAALQERYLQQMTVRVRRFAERVAGVTGRDAAALAVEDAAAAFRSRAALLLSFSPVAPYAEIVAQAPGHTGIKLDPSRNYGELFRSAFEHAPGAALASADLSDHALHEALRTALRTADCQQWIAAPLLAGTNINGVILLLLPENSRQRQFLRQEREQLLLLAQVISSAYYRVSSPTTAPLRTLDDNVFRQFVEQLQRPVDFSSADGRALYRNPSWYEVFGASKDDSTPLQDYFALPANARVHRDLSSAGSSEGWTDLVLMRRADNAEFEAQLNVVPLRDPDGGIVGYGSLLTDMSDLSRVLDNLQPRRRCQRVAGHHHPDGHRRRHRTRPDAGLHAVRLCRGTGLRLRNA